MTRRRFIAVLVTITVVHFFIGLGSLAFGYGMGMARFDSGAEERAVESVLNFLGHYLLLPGALLWSPGMSSPLQLVVVLANSLMWSTVITSIYAASIARRRRSAAF